MKLNLKHFPQLRSLLEQVGMFRETVNVNAGNNIIDINNGEVRFTIPKHARTLYVTKQNGAKYRVTDWYDLVELSTIYEIVGGGERTQHSDEVVELIKTHFPLSGDYIDITLSR